jgi:hypothetical protein
MIILMKPQMAGRNPEALANAFEPYVQSICNWVARQGAIILRFRGDLWISRKWRYETVN